MNWERLLVAIILLGIVAIIAVTLGREWAGAMNEAAREVGQLAD